MNINEALRRYKSTNIIETNKKIEKLKDLKEYFVSDLEDPTYKLLSTLKNNSVFSFDEIDIIAEEKKRVEEIRLKKIQDANNWYQLLSQEEKEMIAILMSIK